jgi:ribonuclease P protein subunit RPR2
VSYRGSRRWRNFVTDQLRNLYKLAEEVAVDDGELARRYVLVARRIVLRTRVRLPYELRHRSCHRCGVFFRPGVNVRVRLRSRGRQSSLVLTCLVCGFRRKIVWRRHREKLQESQE